MTRTERYIDEYRKSTACIQVRDTRGEPQAGVHVSVEQEEHKFPFACITADPSALSERDRDRYQARLHEVFNRVYSLIDNPSASGKAIAVQVSQRTHLGTLRQTLDRLSGDGQLLDVYISGRSVTKLLGPGRPELECLSEQDFGHRVVELYTLCFSHPAVRQIVWAGLSDQEPEIDGGGLLRRDMSPKHAHKWLRKLIDTVWHTRAQGVTDGRGIFQFRGFFGTYRVVVTSALGRVSVNKLSLHRDATRSVSLSVEIRL